MNRTGFIGSSEIAAVLGVGRFKTQLQLWAEKTGEIKPPDLALTNESVEWGCRLESVVAEKFSEKNNVKLMAYKKRFRHKKYDFLRCELDRIIVGTDEIVEVKTTSAWNYKAWEDEEIPLDYIYQVQFALGLTERKIGHFAVLIGGNKYIERRIEFDQELYDIMIERAVQFWEYNVKKHIPPVAIAKDKEILVDLFPTNLTNEIIEANNEIEEAIAMRQELDMHMKELKLQKENIEARIKQVIGNNAGLITRKYKITWLPQTRIDVDTKKLKEDGLYEKYAKPSNLRMFKVNLNKEKK